MNTKQLILAGCSIVVLSVGSAMAGPCDTGGRAANLKDAGSGPASVGSGQTTTGMATEQGTSADQHDESRIRRCCGLFAGCAEADAGSFGVGAGF